MQKKSLRSLLLIVSIALVFIFFLIGLGGYVLLKRSLPSQYGRLSFKELQNSVEITFDSLGIPQIWAKNESDAYFASGYLHAADRLFQMDLTRRVSQGQLSELLGKTTLEFDRQQRTIGHHRLAHSWPTKLSPENTLRLQAYADGVNAYVRTCQALPFEYQLLQAEFDQWTMFDCLTIFSFQTWFANALMNKDEFYLKIVEKAGREKAQTLAESYPDWAPTTIPSPKVSAIAPWSFKEIFAVEILSNQIMPFLMSHSSNSWVVAPQRSASGSAMLASDPHLETSRLPQFWYYLGLHIENPKTDILGISAPGLPFITMGHNGQAAWAFTVGGIDVSDFYIEQLHPQDSSLYLTPQGWKKFVQTDEKIIIAGEHAPETLSVWLSRHGPLLFRNDSLKQTYALRWAGYDCDPEKSITAAFDLMRVDNFNDFQRIVTNFGALDANWTFADRSGNIGYQLGSPLPIRHNFDGMFPLPGWTDEYEWQGYQPLNKSPHSFNPRRGWLSTCNNKQDQENLDYPLTGTFAYDRILRITELLESQQKFSVADMQRFQMDNTDKYLWRWKDHLAVLLDSLAEPVLAEKMRSWDGSADVQSQEMALAALYLSRLEHLIFDDELGTLARRISPLMLENILQQSEAEWYDNIATADHVETRMEILHKALNEAITALGQRRWGDIHTMSMQHPLAIVPIISSLLNLKTDPLPWHGTSGTLNASFFFEDKKQPGRFQSIIGPSWRFVIDFSDVDGATMVLPAGNSGNPMSPHFMDFSEMWKTGARWNVPLSREKVLEKSVRQLFLLPQNEQ